MKTYLYEFEVYHHFSGLCFVAEVNFWRPPKTVNSCNLSESAVALSMQVWHVLYHPLIQTSG